MGKKLFEKLLTDIKDAGNGTLTGMANFRSVDRGGDLVLPSAFKSSLELFLKNPLFMLGHNISGDPIGGLPIGSVTEAVITDDGLKFTASFASTPVAKMVHTLFLEKHLKAFSIGFFIKENGSRDPNEEELEEFGADVKRVVTDLELVEISAVPAPMNRESLVMAVKSLREGGALKTSSVTIKEGAGKKFAAAAKKTVEDILRKFKSKAVSDETAELIEAVVVAYEAWVPSLKMITEAIAGLKAVAADGEAEDGDALASAEALAEGLSGSSDAVSVFTSAVDALISALGGEEEDDDEDDDNDDDDNTDDDNDGDDEASLSEEDLKTLTASVEALNEEAERVLKTN